MIKCNIVSMQNESGSTYGWALVVDATHAEVEAAGGFPIILRPDIYEEFFAPRKSDVWNQRRVITRDDPHYEDWLN